MCNTIDILKLLNISLPAPSINNTLIGQLLHLLAFYIECSLAQSKQYHQMMYLLRYPVYNTSHGLPLTRPAEAVRPLRPWSDQNFCHLRSKSYIFKILVGPIIVWSRFFLSGRTNLGLLPPPLIEYVIRG